MAIVKNEIENTRDYHYRAFGLNIRSRIEISGLIPAEGEPDIDIRYGDVPESLEDPVRSGPRFQAKPGHLLFTVDNIARYWVSNGKQVVIAPYPGTNETEIRAFLLGAPLGAVIHQRGLFPLHGSSLKIQDKCVIFSGFSGSGKSTIARAFINRGYHLHGDDVCAISIGEDGIPIVLPEYPRTKLWEDAAKKLDQETSVLLRTRQSLLKFEISAAGAFNKQPLPLQKIYILDPWNKKSIKLTTITGIDKFHLLNRHIYHRKFTSGLGKEVFQFKNAGAIGKKVTLVRVQRPLNPFLLDELADLLEKDFLE
ncbi:MAG: hypothetical protein GY757_38515 [bacterium]|nr:hypothetical protein [bacterium]